MHRSGSIVLAAIAASGLFVSSASGEIMAYRITGQVIFTFGVPNGDFVVGDTWQLDLTFDTSVTDTLFTARTGEFAAITKYDFGLTGGAGTYGGGDLLGTGLVRTRTDNPTNRETLDFIVDDDDHSNTFGPIGGQAFEQAVFRLEGPVGTLNDTGLGQTLGEVLDGSFPGGYFTGISFQKLDLVGDNNTLVRSQIDLIELIPAPSTASFIAVPLTLILRRRR